MLAQGFELKGAAAPAQQPGARIAPQITGGELQRLPQPCQRRFDLNRLRALVQRLSPPQAQPTQLRNAQPRKGMHPAHATLKLMLRNGMALCIGDKFHLAACVQTLQQRAEFLVDAQSAARRARQLQPPRKALAEPGALGQRAFHAHGRSAPDHQEIDEQQSEQQAVQPQQQHPRPRQQQRQDAAQRRGDNQPVEAA
jgi:hypothetical protein